MLELLNIVLSHSTHHLKQVYHYMTTGLGMTIEKLGHRSRSWTESRRPTP